MSNWRTILSWEELQDEYLEDWQGFFRERKYPSGEIYRYNKEGKLHNTRGPAIIHLNGSVEYWVNGKRHRTDGPAFIGADGMIAYYQNGLYHRTDGPALIGSNGYKVYYQNGKPHRTDGPAVVNPDGTVEYWVNGKKLSEEEFNEKYGRNRQASFFRLSTPETYTDASDVDQSKQQYEDRTQQFHHEDHLMIDNGRDWSWGETDYIMFPSTKVYQDMDEPTGDSNHARNASLKLSWEEFQNEYLEDWQGFFREEKAEDGIIWRYNKKGELHNTRGPAVIHPNGTVSYFVNHKLHRTDGPAYIGSDGKVVYWVDDKLHRTDGPAVVNPDGTVEYWVNSEELSEEEFNRRYGRNRLSSQEYFDSTPSEEFTPEEVAGLAILPDRKLRRTNPKRYEPTTDWYVGMNENSHDSFVSNRYDNPPG